MSKRPAPSSKPKRRRRKSAVKSTPDGGAPSPLPKSGAERKQIRSKSWDAVAGWYSGWSGPEGSRHHRERAMPTLIELLQPRKGERILDIGCGAGALCSAVSGCGADYVGVDLSEKLIALARKHHRGRSFHVGDATRLPSVNALSKESFDGATFLLSLQDINPLGDAIDSAAWALKPGGRLVLLLIHPCFRIPRQSGWGVDEQRKLKFRRVDKYLSELDVPMQEYDGGRQGVTRSYHRPLEAYVNTLFAHGLVTEELRETPAPPPKGTVQEPRIDRLAREDIPLFLGLRARKRQLRVPLRTGKNTR
ncbi:MAG: class I SAM-dependent methyltransferase [Alphaproteobacteria bacterium GM202ARS2]|nr:class I SAM-dependent methyltransferase [Alphaproteobacteria bacterium GM202ARS2]